MKRELFTQEQRHLIIELARRHRSGSGKVDWGRVMQDPDSKRISLKKKVLAQLYIRSMRQLEGGRLVRTENSRPLQVPTHCPQCGLNLKPIIAAMNL